MFPSTAFAIFRLRISLCRGVFSDDARNHESDSAAAIMTRGSSSFSADDTSKQLKSLRKVVGCDFFSAAPEFANFARENESKTLAFCAARSHLVALRYPFPVTPPLLAPFLPTLCPSVY